MRKLAVPSITFTFVQSPLRSRSRVLAAAVLSAGATIGTLASCAPASAQRQDTPVSQVAVASAIDTAVLMRRLTALAHDSMEGRGAGTPGGKRGRDYLERELRALGVAPAGATYQLPVRVRARPGADTLGANVVAIIPGRRGGGPVLVLSAHHDHLGIRNDSIFNGADDDASGSVALLSLAEQFRKMPLEHDVLLAWFEAEESGMLGSRAFVESPPVEASRIAVNVNLDMISRHDAGRTLWITGTAPYPFLKPMAETAISAASVRVRFGHDTAGPSPSDNWTGASDHASFHRQRIPFLYLGVEDHPDYHRPGDDANKVEPAFFASTVSFAEALVRALDARLGEVHAAGMRGR